MSVKRLKLGLRVYVERDALGELVGAWGNVARECWGKSRWSKARAWVRLDERHARCPFAAEDQSRASWILTAPEHCSSKGAISNGEIIRLAWEVERR